MLKTRFPWRLEYTLHKHMIPLPCKHATNFLRSRSAWGMCIIEEPSTRCSFTGLSLSCYTPALHAGMGGRAIKMALI